MKKNAFWLYNAGFSFGTIMAFLQVVSMLGVPASWFWVIASVIPLGSALRYFWTCVDDHKIEVKPWVVLLVTAVPIGICLAFSYLGAPEWGMVSSSVIVTVFLIFAMDKFRTIPFVECARRFGILFPGHTTFAILMFLHTETLYAVSVTAAAVFVQGCVAYRTHPIRIRRKAVMLGRA